MHQYRYLEALAYISSILLPYIQLLTYDSAKYRRPILNLPMLKGKLYLATCPTLAQRAFNSPDLCFEPFLIKISPELCCQPKH